MRTALDVGLCRKEQDGWAWTPSGPGMQGMGDPEKESWVHCYQTTGGVRPRMCVQA
jgi:hypothetical protein